MTIPALITVRSASTRLPGKCFLPFGDGPVIEHIIKRCLHYGLRPIICTTNDVSDLTLVDIARANEVEYFQGQPVNKLMRWRDCSRHFDLSYFHTVDADDPFFCGEEVARSVKCMLDGGYDMVSPTVSSASGGATVGYSLKASLVDRACIGTDQYTDTEMMWSYIKKLDDVKEAILPEPETHRIEARLTLDYHEDYILLEAVRILLGSFASRSQVYDLLSENKGLRGLNQFRSDEWAAIQNKKSLIAKEEKF